MADDLIGRRFGRLTVKAAAGWTSNRISRWQCVCECGNAVIVRRDVLLLGTSRSCGCFSRERSRETITARSTKHGHARRGRVTPEYSTWRGMLDRCGQPAHESYVDYGARGIAVCERWRVFEAFLADMGARPPGMSIERNDRNGNYEPGNCRWATSGEQMRNTRRNVVVERDGETLCLRDWCAKQSLDERCVRKRLARGWTMPQALGFEARR